MQKEQKVQRTNADFEKRTGLYWSAADTVVGLAAPTSLICRVFAVSSECTSDTCVDAKQQLLQVILSKHTDR